MRPLSWAELDADPPPAYVDFVARHLAGLRSDVLHALADEHRAECLYPQVLTDVALAWPRLQHAAHRGRPQAAGDYLDQCLHRRLYGRPGDDEQDGVAPALEMRFVVWDAGESGLPHLPPAHRENAAIRLAAHLLPVVDPEPAPLAEAAIAWWHAYEQRRRRRWIVAVLTVVVLILFPLASVGTGSATY